MYVLAVKSAYLLSQPYKLKSKIREGVVIHEIDDTTRFYPLLVKVMLLQFSLCYNHPRSPLYLRYERCKSLCIKQAIAVWRFYIFISMTEFGFGSGLFCILLQHGVPSIVFISGLLM